jgi:hypothetical protein
MPLPSSAFSGSNRSKMGSNAVTDVNQGGGNKKAGLIPLVGKEAWSSIAYGSHNLGSSSSACRSLKCMQFTINSNVHLSRPIGSITSPNTYWTVR